MYTIKSDLNPVATEAYFNKKAQKGYILRTIIPFALFVPLKVNIYRFVKSNNDQRVYRLLKVSPKVISQYQNDGSKLLSSPANYEDYLVMYKDMLFNQKELFGENTRNSYSIIASLGIKEGLILLAIFGLWYTFTTPYHNSSFLGFLLHNSYLVIALITIIISTVVYFKNK
jgi:hypothetical protein